MELYFLNENDQLEINIEALENDFDVEELLMQAINLGDVEFYGKVIEFMYFHGYKHLMADFEVLSVEYKLSVNAFEKSVKKLGGAS